MAHGVIFHRRHGWAEAPLSHKEFATKGGQGLNEFLYLCTGPVQFKSKELCDFGVKHGIQWGINVFEVLQNTSGILVGFTTMRFVAVKCESVVDSREWTASS